MNTPKPGVRRATPGDASLIAALGARTFEASFGADNRPEDMEQYLSQSFSQAHIEAHLAEPSTVFLFACEDKKAVGYAMLRESKTPVSVTGARPVELVRIYVENEIIGAGYGSALLNACLQESKKNGYRTIWLGVWEKNIRAIRFYRKWRFKKVGTKEFVLGSDVQTDHIMARPVDMAVEPLSSAGPANRAISLARSPNIK